MTKIKYIESSSDDFVQAPLAWHLAGLFQTASGYGRKLTTIYKVPHAGRLYRVYATCFSNCASHWIMSKGEKLHVRDFPMTADERLHREGAKSAAMQDALECIMELDDGEGGSPAQIAQEALEATIQPTTTQTIG